MPRGTDQRNGVNCDQQDGSAVGGRRGWAEVVRHTHLAQHAAKSAESDRVRNLAWPSLSGRAVQAFELVESSVVDKVTANSSPRTAAGHKQDDQIVKTKPLMRSCLRVLDQSLGSTRARSSRNRPLEQPCTMRLGCARVDWTSRPLISI